MDPLLDALRKRLKLKPGVVLSEEEIDLALAKTPVRSRMRIEAEVDNRRFDEARRPPRPVRKFGGVR